MSRIGKLPVQIPAGVTITVDNGVVKVAGPKGNLEQPVLDQVTISVENDQLVVARKNDEKMARSQHGLIS